MALILVVDDDRIQRLVAAQALARAGHQLLEANDGAEGLEATRSHRPDLIVCDVLMPGMNGYQFVAALRQEEGVAGTPVIMLTSMSERAHMRAGMNAGADDYLPKPFSFEELNEAVDALLAKRLKLEKDLMQSMNESLSSALEEQRESLAAQYEEQLVQAIGARWEEDAQVAAEVRYDHAVLLKAQIVGSVEHQVGSAKEANALVRRLYDAARDALHLFNAAHLLPAGRDMVALYVDEPGSMRVRAGVRAVRAALSLQQSLANLKAPGNVALHCGPVAVLRMSDPLHGGPDSSLATGPSIPELDAICDAARNAQWSIAASAAYVGEMGGKLATGRSMQAAPPGGAGPIDILEVLSLR